MRKVTLARSDIFRLIKPQTVIWRPLFILNGVMMPQLHRVQPQSNKQASDPVFRVKLFCDDQGICEPTVSTDNKGLVAFLKAPLPEGWTHLVVVRGGKNGSILVTTPECLPSVDDYISWRLQISNLYFSRDIDDEQLAEQVARLDCPGLRTDRKRMQVFLNPDGDYTEYQL